MLNIPRELIWDILLRLQPKDLIRYRCVSKAWYALIHNQDFIKPHLERSIKTNSTRTILLSTTPSYFTPSYFFSLPFDNDEKLETATTVGFSIPSKDPVGETTVTMGYANGLVCICNYIDGDTSYIALWNPAIQQLKKIPIRTHKPRALPSPESEMLDILGFGYNSTNDDYKLVGIIRKPANEYEVSVYSLKANSWKRIQNMPCSGFSLRNNHMVFSKGALSWLMWKKLHHEVQYMIVTLDLASEKYREFPIPVDRIDEIKNSMLELDALGDYLCICVNRLMNRCEAWIMKEYGVTESWSLLYSIDMEPASKPWEYQPFKPVVFSKNGKTVLLKMSKTFESDSLVWYDLEKKSFKQVEISGLPGVFNFKATICWGSLCLLDGDPVIV